MDAALELRQHKITVNAYAPGLIITPLSECFETHRQRILSERNGPSPQQRTLMMRRTAALHLQG